MAEHEGVEEKKSLLLNMPPSARRLLLSPGDDQALDRPIGRMITSIDTLTLTTKVELELLDADGAIGPGPFLMKKGEMLESMSILSDNKGKCSMDKVEGCYSLQHPEASRDDYWKTYMEESKRGVPERRQVQVYDDVGVRQRPLMIQGADAVVDTRMDRQQLEETLFGLFERQNNWSLKQLVSQTHQPKRFLKELLAELCFYIKRGELYGTYELKPEYKKS